MDILGYRDIHSSFLMMYPEKKRLKVYNEGWLLA